MPSKQNWAYLAGLVDADGHITLRFDKRRCFVSPVVAVTNTDVPLLFWLKETFGGHVYVGKQRRNPKHSPLCVWSITGQPAVNMAMILRHYLRIKNAQAELLLAYQASHQATPHGRNIRITDEERARRLRFITSVRWLNRPNKGGASSPP